MRKFCYNTEPSHPHTLTQTLRRRVCAHTHNFRLLLRHFFFGHKLLSFLHPVRERRVSQELLNELRTIQVVLRFPRVLCTVGQREGGEGSVNHYTHTHTFAHMEVQRPTHSVKPFHFRKYSTLPFRTLRRMILSTANSCTTAVSSVFLCLAVCFFLILPSTTNTRAAGHERIPNSLQAFVTTRHWRNETARFFFCPVWKCAGNMAARLWSNDPHTYGTPAAPPAVPTFLYCYSNPHILTPFNACTCTITTESSVGLGVIVCQQQAGNAMVGALCTYAVAVYWISVDGCTAAVLLGAYRRGGLCARAGRWMPFSARMRR